MSFSSDIKQELNKTNSLTNKENVKFELIGYVISGNTTVVKGKNFRFSTESDYNINRFSKLLSNLDIHHDIDISGKTFNIVTKALDISKLEFLEIRDNEIFLKPEFEDIKASNKDMQKGTQKNTRLEENMKAFIRGAFMGAGSINNPENSYHLEIAVSNEENLNFFCPICGLPNRINSFFCPEILEAAQRKALNYMYSEINHRLGKTIRDINRSGLIKMEMKIPHQEAEKELYAPLKDYEVVHEICCDVDVKVKTLDKEIGIYCPICGGTNL